jgi:hypothetical protein
MSASRYDLTVQDGQGRALSGAEIFFCSQPADTAVFPPTPLASIFSDTEGAPLTQPVITDGFGHADAYLTLGTLYTVVVNHPLFFQPLVYTDQQAGGTGTGVTPVQASTAAGTITGTIPGTVFTLPSVPLTGSLSLAQNGVTLTPGLGYTISGAVITLATALASGDSGLNATYLAS